MNCIVCDKEIHSGDSNTCSTGCFLKTWRGEGKVEGEAKKAGSQTFLDNMQKVLTSGTPKVQEVPVLKVAHPWVRNKNIVAGNVVFSFNNEGVARVQDLAGAREAIQQLVSSQRKFFVPEDSNPTSLNPTIEVVLESPQAVEEPPPPQVGVEEPQQLESSRPVRRASKRPFQKKPVSKNDEG